jgi:hypothetical protein
MTIQELYDQTAQLGFETSLEDDFRFIQAANRALLQVNRIRPQTSVAVINHYPFPNLIRDTNFEPVRKDSDDICFEATGVKAYYFESDISKGAGNVLVEYLSNNGWQTVLDFANTGKLTEVRTLRAFRGLIRDENGNFFDESVSVRIRFTGDFAYTIRSVALYGKIHSLNEEDIPTYSEYTRYNLMGITADFSAFCCPPIRDEGEYRFLSKDFHIEGRSTILFPRSHPDIYHVWYERKLKPITTVNNKDTVDLDEDLASIMPLLIASYVWLDDEPAKASYYLSLYREQEALIRAEEKRLNPITIKNVNGW